LFAAVLILGWCGGALRSAEVIPPAPPAYFNDYAGVTSPATARALEDELSQFERETSNQILVAVYPRMQSDSSIEDYTVRVAQAWKAGQKGRDNGAILFVFTQEHKLYIQTGYGLEGALPDAICKRIIEEEIVPRFRRGDYDGGLAAGVKAILAAARGEYRGTGKTAAENRAGRNGGISTGFMLLLFLLLGLWSLVRSRRHVVYGRGGRSGVWGGGPWIFPGGGGGGWSGGGGGGGGFSGGGGGFGGGGAGGSW
jgi:uncharacterized protein